jgi:hypothetical protein
MLWQRCFAAAALALMLGAAPSRAEPPAGPAPAGRPWRVCITDLQLPPYLNNDPARLGVSERLLIDAGRRVGLAVELLRYPIRRCRLLFDGGELEAVVAAPIATNQQTAQFPMKDGAVDAERRVARLALVWVKRSDSALGWDGRQLTGLAPAAAPPLVGIRGAARLTTEALQPLGVGIDEAALSSRQLLAKLAAGRVDLAIGLREDLEALLRERERAGERPALQMLNKPLLISDFHVALRLGAPESERRLAEAWWTEIGRMRELPDYRPWP